VNSPALMSAMYYACMFEITGASSKSGGSVACLLPIAENVARDESMAGVLKLWVHLQVMTCDV
jgi:hypothetical protein